MAGFQAASRNWEKFDGGKYLVTGLLAGDANRANATASSTTADLAFCPNPNRRVTEKFSRFSAPLIGKRVVTPQNRGFPQGDADLPAGCSRLTATTLPMPEVAAPLAC